MRILLNCTKKLFLYCIWLFLWCLSMFSMPFFIYTVFKRNELKSKVLFCFRDNFFSVTISCENSGAVTSQLSAKHAASGLFVAFSRLWNYVTFVTELIKAYLNFFNFVLFLQTVVCLYRIVELCTIIQISYGFTIFYIHVTTCRCYHKKCQFSCQLFQSAKFSKICNYY